MLCGDGLLLLSIETVLDTSMPIALQCQGVAEIVLEVCQGSMSAAV